MPFDLDRYNEVSCASSLDNESQRYICLENASPPVEVETARGVRIPLNAETMGESAMSASEKRSVALLHTD